MDPSITLGRKTLRSDKGMDPTITLGRKMIQCDKGMDPTIPLDRKTIQSDKADNQTSKQPLIKVGAELQEKEENDQQKKPGSRQHETAVKKKKKKKKQMSTTPKPEQTKTGVSKSRENELRCNRIQIEKEDPSNRCPVKNRKKNKEKKNSTCTLLRSK
ncbi:hypothetical protein CHS0354_011844 [Potamilus streckersoni]|uniref:Uncharacterized protein n=1 Tax=Potamilus streckersoni TaxID=2493646 RepID=A0AAE0TFN7_9BIVA|nr:hypothetical protein CHS0354_011844 [Potamilus streckersoni]